MFNLIEGKKKERKPGNVAKSKGGKREKTGTKKVARGRGREKMGQALGGAQQP